MSWLKNLISGWLPIGVNSSGDMKSFGEWLGKIIWVVGIVLVVLIAWNRFTKPTTNTNQTVEKGAYAVTNNNALHSSWGCANMRVIQYYYGNKEVK